ncbi:helix-turn-helix domain-containing protein, partial [Streptomyces decoyicus]|uniref:helix-turn-helix domain-containing protein n=1 Tax=Streptomyces decoyicus TaxID=249567 RepID=UPI003F4CFDE1
SSTKTLDMHISWLRKKLGRAAVPERWRLSRRSPCGRSGRPRSCRCCASTGAHGRAPDG